MTLETDFGIIDFVNDTDRGAGLLPEFLKNADNVVGLINAIIPEIQEINDAQSDVYTTINIFDAIGTQLDDIYGEILDTPRELLQSDDDYRTVLLAVAPSIGGSGTIRIIKNTLRSLAGADIVSLLEVPLHTIILHAFVDDFLDIISKTSIDDNMKLVKAGGVGMTIGVQLNSSAFIFSDDVAGGAIGEGFSEVVDGTGGGTFARITIISLTFITESGDTFITESGDTFITETTY